MKLLQELNNQPLRNRMNQYLIGTLTNMHTLRVQEKQVFKTDEELKSHCARKYGAIKWTSITKGGLQGWSADNKPIVVAVSRPMPNLLRTEVH